MQQRREHYKEVLKKQIDYVYNSALRSRQFLTNERVSKSLKIFLSPCIVPHVKNKSLQILEKAIEVKVIFIRLYYF